MIWETVAAIAVLGLVQAGMFALGAYIVHRVGFWNVRSETLERAETLKAAVEGSERENTLRTMTEMGWKPPARERSTTSHPGGPPIPTPGDIEEEKAWSQIEKTLSRG